MFKTRIGFIGLLGIVCGLAVNALAAPPGMLDPNLKVWWI